jgi:hypothetical protein
MDTYAPTKQKETRNTPIIKHFRTGWECGKTCRATAEKIDPKNKP